MNDNDLEMIYKQNVAVSHFAGLRGLFDAGYAMGQGSGAPTQDQSLSANAATATADTPNVTTA